MSGLRALGILLRTVLLGLLAAGSAHAQVDTDDADWQIAQADGSVRAYERYLERHPVGRYASAAFAAIASRAAREAWGVAAVEPEAGRSLAPAAGPVSIY